ncbi:MAG: sigma-70 family RNA polymerase sigma factor [Labilithrix sp.]|nr:sigma-70 family RNA polymerase sigma factor [Labilithrix sp.]
MRVIANLLGRRAAAKDEDVLSERDVARLYEAHAPFVYATLQRLGVRAGDLEDVLQEVFVVVQRRVHTFDGTSKATTWLFGICLRVVSAYRRRGFRKNETSVAEPPERVDDRATPEESLAEAESRRRLGALLDEMDLEKRAVFVMFEIDELPCEEIASILGVPTGTVHSRLHAARKSFQAALLRMQARDARRLP